MAVDSGSIKGRTDLSVLSVSGGRKGASPFKAFSDALYSRNSPRGNRFFACLKTETEGVCDLMQVKASCAESQRLNMDRPDSPRDAVAG